MQQGHYAKHKRQRKKAKWSYLHRPPLANDAFFRAAPMAAGAPPQLPPAIDLRRWCFPIRFQGQELSCVGFAVAAFRELSHALATNTTLPGYLSPSYIYAWARKLENSFPADNGTSVSKGFETLTNLGVCPEGFFPYDQNPSEIPSPNSDTAALPFRIFQPQRVAWSDPNYINAFLAQNQPVVIAFCAYDSFEGVGPDGRIPMPDTSFESLKGGHAVTICGYDQNAAIWIIRNQFGPAWGDHGYGYMPYAYTSLWTEAWTGELIA